MLKFKQDCKEFEAKRHKDSTKKCTSPNGIGGGSISGGPSALPMEMHGTITLGKIIFNW